MRKSVHVKCDLIWKEVRYVLVFLFIATLASCESNSPEVSQSVPHDPSKPVEMTSFTPDSGGIRTKFVIKGTNFGNDKSKVAVYFQDFDRERKATVIGVDNETIYCLVPKQSGGANGVKVVVESKEATSSKKFKYIVAQNLSLVTGLSGVAGSTDGNLVNARVQRTFGVAALGNDELITFETLSNAVRFISITSNKVVTIQTGFDGTQPALSKDRTKMYAIGRSFPHKVFVYDKNNLWAPKILAGQIAPATDIVFSACLDNTEKWLYFRDKRGVFGRLEIANPSNVEVIKAASAIVGTTDYNFMVYSAFDDCFYASVQSGNTIYKIQKDGNSEIYSGGNGAGRINGNRLDASYNGPAGLCVDSEGNLYIGDSNNHVIRKIDRKSGFVTTVAGIAGTSGGLSGVPLQSTFSFPYSFMADENDAVFIGESWGCTVRKLAIE